ncbi:unnamed protein product [Wuchereria bancrofti]|uniref:Uncharacterized protein n=2 Tax=Wuchereria bancrofti TaxID=6293 RepID=A0A3P7GCQ2_WUCBA|nr:unnamed protein product [Wuchereria bancrofti]
MNKRNYICILHHISPISIPCGQTNDDRRDVDDGGNVGDATGSVHDGDDTDAMVHPNHRPTSQMLSPILYISCSQFISTATFSLILLFLNRTGEMVSLRFATILLLALLTVSVTASDWWDDDWDEPWHQYHHHHYHGQFPWNHQHFHHHPYYSGHHSIGH